MSSQERSGQSSQCRDRLEQISEVYPSPQLSDPVSKGSDDLPDTQPVSLIFSSSQCSQPALQAASGSQNTLMDTQPVSQVFPSPADTTSNEVSSKDEDDTLPVSQVFPEITPTDGDNRGLNSQTDTILDSQNTTIEISKSIGSDTDFSEEEIESNSKKKGSFEPMSIKVSSECTPLSTKLSTKLSSNSLDPESTNGTDSIEKICDISDAEIIPSSQDIFSSQASVSSTINTASTSQLVPTFQLSGEFSYLDPKFLPERLIPSSPCDSKNNTSSPVKSEEIISLSDDEINITSDERNTSPQGEKRKLSDCSEDSERIVSLSKKQRKTYVDSRQSIMVLGEVCKHQKSVKTGQFRTGPGSMSTSQSDSQAFRLRMSASQSDQDTAESPGVSGSSTISMNGCYKPDSDSNPSISSNELKESSVCDTVSRDRDNSNSNLNTSIFPLDDAEDDVQVVSPKKSSIYEEITLDNSGHQPAISTSHDGIEILSPTCVQRDLKTVQGRCTETSTIPFGSPAETTALLPPASFPSFNQRLRAKPQNADSVSPSKQTDIKEYEKEFSLSFVYNYKITCKVLVNTQEKKIVKASVLKLQDCESRTSPDNEQRQYLSPRAYESSSVPSQESPGSVYSGLGPFSLSKRQSVVSTISSSSGSSSASGMYKERPLHHLSASHRQTYAGSTNHQDTDNTVYEDMIQLDAVPNSFSGFRLMGQWASSASQHVNTWASGLVESDGPDMHESVPNDTNGKLDSVQEDDGEELLGVVASNSKKLPAARGGRKKPAARKEGAPRAATPRSLRKKPRQDEKISLNPEPEVPKESAPIKTGNPKLARELSPVRPALNSDAINPSTPKQKAQSLPSNAIPTAFPLRENKSLTYKQLFAPGSPVFALWDRDTTFYPGELISKSTRSNQWIVKFHDDKTKSIHENNICLISTLEIGQSVYAKTENNDYAMGVVELVESVPIGNDDVYTVKLQEGGEVKVLRSDLCLKGDQAKVFTNGYLPGVTSSSATSPHKRIPGCKLRDGLDLGQVIDGNRKRTPNRTGRYSPSVPGPSSAARELIPDSSLAAEDDPLASLLVTGVQPEQQGSACLDPLARKGRGIKKKQASELDLDNEELIKRYGPLPPLGSKIFSGKYFLVTCTDAKPLHKLRPNHDSSLQSSDGETEETEGNPTKSQNSDADRALIKHHSDSECFEFSHHPISKVRLCLQIERGSGTVVDSVTKIIPSYLKSTFVVTDRPCFTATYLLCMAKGIQSLNHDAIIDCCKTNKKLLMSDLPNYLLPVGWSILKGDFVSWRDHRTKSPLSGKKILVTGDKNFVQFWEEVVRLAGATVINVRSEKDVDQDTIVVSDNPCPESVLQWATEVKVPVVSPEWVKQTLINNKALMYNAHKIFAYDCSDVD